jgi:hypothetical protein
MAKVFEKHKKYKSTYGSSELFWGLGIELETYFQFAKPIQVAAPIMRLCHKPERYSVDYYKSYTHIHTNMFDKLFPDSSGCFPLPFFINGHALSKLDRYGVHATTYEKVPKPNPKFAGKTLLDELSFLKLSEPSNEYLLPQSESFHRIQLPTVNAGLV